jgi:hypothetical protein
MEKELKETNKYVKPTIEVVEPAGPLAVAGQTGCGPICDSGCSSVCVPAEECSSGCVEPLTYAAVMVGKSYATAYAGGWSAGVAA